MMKTPTKKQHEESGCTNYLQHSAQSCPELFEPPFNLAGELLDNSLDAEGEARAKASAEAEARKAQQTFYDWESNLGGSSVRNFKE